MIVQAPGDGSIQKTIKGLRTVQRELMLKARQGRITAPPESSPLPRKMVVHAGADDTSQCVMDNSKQVKIPQSW
jgi:hypothetical protein